MANEFFFKFKTYFRALGSNTDEIHIFYADRGDVLDLESFKKKIEKIYPVLEKKAYSLKYIDEEGDEVSLENYEDYRLTLSEKKSVNVNVTNKIRIKEIKGKDGSVDSHNVVHVGVVCDECDSQIQGFRYKCLECNDYDLCEKCEGMHIHQDHLMLRLGMPSPCPVYVRARGRDDCRSFLLAVPKFGADEGRCDCRRRKGKEKHRKHSGRCSEKRENDDDGTDWKREKRLKKPDFPDYVQLFNNFIRKYDKFINPSVIVLREDEGTMDASPLGQCRETIAGVANACLNTIFGQQDVPCGGKCSTEKAKEENENKASSEEKAKTPENENKGTKAEGNDSTNLEELVKQFASQTVSVEKESPVTSQGNGDKKEMAAPQPKSDEPNPTVQPDNNPVENGDRFRLSNDIVLALYEMLSMGISNEDGRLLQLLIENDGDISKVIDILFQN